MKRKKLKKRLLAAEHRLVRVGGEIGHLLGETRRLRQDVRAFGKQNYQLANRLDSMTAELYQQDDEEFDETLHRLKSMCEQGSYRHITLDAITMTRIIAKIDNLTACNLQLSGALGPRTEEDPGCSHLS